jgi:choline kinase
MTKTRQSGLQNDRMRIKMNLGKTWGVDKNKKDIDIIHIGLYHLEIGIFDIAMSF